MKPENILISSDQREMGRLKLTDFGMARRYLDSVEPLSKQGTVCTLWYRAPELLIKCHGDCSREKTGGLNRPSPNLGIVNKDEQLYYHPVVADIWSVGCVAAEMLLYRPLFQSQQLSWYQVDPVTGRVRGEDLFERDQLKKILSVIPCMQPRSSLYHIHHSQYLDVEFSGIQNALYYTQTKECVETIKHSPTGISDAILSQLPKNAPRLNGSGYLDVVESMLKFDPNERSLADVS